MWIDTFGAYDSGASGGAAIKRSGLRPNATAAISSSRESAIRTSGTSRISPSESANAAPVTK